MNTRTTTTQLRSAKRKKGFTLTEIAIVLGIIGLILGAIWTAAAAVYANQRIAHANTALLQVEQGMRSLMATASTVGSAGDMTAAAISAGIIPTDLVTGNTAIGPWPGSTLKVLTVTAADTAFTIEMNGVPRAGCIALLTNAGGTSRDPGLMAVASTTAAAATATSAAVGQAVAGTALAVVIAPLALPVLAANAVTGCSAVTNPVQFEFSLK